jgi:hypothetical protein
VIGVNTGFGPDLCSVAMFVHQLEGAGPQLGLTATRSIFHRDRVAALTRSKELSEMVNVVRWVRQGRTDLALANIRGGMMIQATVFSGVWILFILWRFDTQLILAAASLLARYRIRPLGQIPSKPRGPSILGHRVFSALGGQK